MSWHAAMFHIKYEQILYSIPIHFFPDGTSRLGFHP